MQYTLKEFNEAREEIIRFELSYEESTKAIIDELHTLDFDFFLQIYDKVKDLESDQAFFLLTELMNEEQKNAVYNNIILDYGLFLVETVDDEELHAQALQEEEEHYKKEVKKDNVINE